MVRGVSGGEREKMVEEIRPGLESGRRAVSDNQLSQHVGRG